MFNCVLKRGHLALNVIRKWYNFYFMQTVVNYHHCSQESREMLSFYWVDKNKMGKSGKI